MTIEEAIKRFQSNAEYERTHGNLQGCLEFRQLAEWLRKYQKIEEIVGRYGFESSWLCLRKIRDVLEGDEE